VFDFNITAPQRPPPPRRCKWVFLPHSAQSPSVVFSARCGRGLAEAGAICLPGGTAPETCSETCQSRARPKRNDHAVRNVRGQVIKIAALVVISLALASAMTGPRPGLMRPSGCVAFFTGMMHGALMPPPCRPWYSGKDLPILPRTMLDEATKIGFILGLNTCGTLFFGVGFYKRGGEGGEGRSDGVMEYWSIE